MFNSVISLFVFYWRFMVSLSLNWNFLELGNSGGDKMAMAALKFEDTSISEHRYTRGS